MIRRLILGVVLLTLAAPLSAQDPYRAFEQITVAGTAIGFTSATISAGSNSTSGHPQANKARCRVRTAQLSFRDDGGTPTATVGTVLDVGDVYESADPIAIRAFLAIRTGGTSGQLDCMYAS